MERIEFSSAQDTCPRRSIWSLTEPAGSLTTGPTSLEQGLGIAAKAMGQSCSHQPLPSTLYILLPSWTQTTSGFKKKKINDTKNQKYAESFFSVAELSNGKLSPSLGQRRQESQKSPAQAMCWVTPGCCPGQEQTLGQEEVGKGLV